MNKDNRCSIPFTGYAHVMLDKNTVSPCCKVRQSPILNGNLITRDAIEIRTAIKENKRHSLCSECWMVEDNGGPSFRIRNSQKIDFDSVEINQPYNKVILVFSNKCQMMCAYCGPAFSSMWENKKGIIPIITGTDNIEKILSNNTFKDISVSGGEPMLDDNCVRFLMDLEFDPSRIISMVTNLSYGPAVFHKLIKIIEKHPTIHVGCSIDAIGNNISRKYLNWELWNINFNSLADNLQERLIRYPDTTIYTKSTVGLLNYMNIQGVIEYVLNFRLRGYKGITFDINPLSDNSVTSLSSGNIDNNVRVLLDKRYLDILMPKERMLIRMTNALLDNVVYNPELSSVTDEHIKKYVD